HDRIELGAGQEGEHDRADAREKFDPPFIGPEHGRPDEAGEDQLANGPDHDLRQRRRDSQPDREQGRDHREAQPQRRKCPHARHALPRLFASRSANQEATKNPPAAGHPPPPPPFSAGGGINRHGGFLWAPPPPPPNPTPAPP